jgi:hypothetical protein
MVVGVRDHVDDPLAVADEGEGVRQVTMTQG